MEDKSDNNDSEDGLRNKRSVRKRKPTGRTTCMFTSVGRETTFRTTVTAPISQTKTSNPDSCEKEKFDGCGRLAVKKRNIQVKEEYVSSGEEDISGKGKGLVSSREEDVFRKGKEHGSSREADASEKGEHVTFREVDTSEKGEEHVTLRDTFRKGKERVSSREADTSEKGKEHGSFRETDTPGKGEEHGSSREADTSEKGEQHGSSREADTPGKREEHVFFRKADTFRKGEQRVSSREADRSEQGKRGSSREDDTSGKGKEHVSSAEEDPSSGVGDLGSIETVLVEDSPDTQHKQGWDMLKFNIGRSREISEDLRKQVVEAHKSGKGYKRIAKDLDLHQSTVRQIVYKWKKFSTVATLPRSGRPTKIGAKARCTILKHLTENPRVTAKDLKASLALDNINVHESTIRKTLNKWCSWDFIMEEDTAVQPE